MSRFFLKLYGSAIAARLPFMFWSVATGINVLVGGLVIGIVESLAGFYLPEGFKDIAAYVVVLVMLVVKPNGLFGDNLAKKV